MAFASLLRGTFLDSDAVGRIGGNESAVLVWNCSEANAAVAAQRLQTRRDAHNRAAARGYDIRFSVDQVTADTSRRCTVEALLAEADVRMHVRTQT